jgi:hypothetical protein
MPTDRLSPPQENARIPRSEISAAISAAASQNARLPATSPMKKTPAKDGQSLDLVFLVQMLQKNLRKRGGGGTMRMASWGCDPVFTAETSICESSETQNCTPLILYVV